MPTPHTPSLPAAAPAYNSSGELIYSGADRKMGGVLEYYHDVLYVAAFVQLAGSFSDWSWLTLLVVRGCEKHAWWQVSCGAGGMGFWAC
jgi:hypothetical protein